MNPLNNPYNGNVVEKITKKLRTVMWFISVSDYHRKLWRKEEIMCFNSQKFTRVMLRVSDYPRNVASRCVSQLLI